MAIKLQLNLIGDQTMVEYFKGVSSRLAEIGMSRAALAREMGIGADQLGRYFNSDDPNPTVKTLVAIEEAIATLRRQRAQAPKPTAARGSDA